MLGYSQQDVKDGILDWTKFTPPEFLYLDEKAIKEATEKGYWTPFEKECLHKEGRRVPILIGGTVFKKDSDEFIVFIIDLTERKQQEEQLRRIQKMDALGKLTGGIAHDYNNMLSVILGFSDLLERALSDQPKLAKYAHQIHHASERGAKLTKKLLAFSLPKNSDARKLDLNALLQNELNMLGKTLTARIQLDLDLAEDLWSVWLDNSDLEDAILNMSINAMHAMNDMESGAQLITCTSNHSLNAGDALVFGLKAGDYVQLSFTDNGVGMDQSTKEKIFDPFFSTKGDKGTGLGLSQVFGFVKRAEGSIKVYLKPGHGSQFVLNFPRYLDDEFNKATETSEEIIDLRGHESILVVDDEADLYDLNANLLSLKGYQIFCAENGKQALQILEHEHIDLILSDIIMPEMGGYQLAAKVKEKYPLIKIQLVTGYTDKRHVNTVDKSLIQNLLIKPYDSQVLFKHIRALLDEV